MFPLKKINVAFEGTTTTRVDMWPVDSSESMQGVLIRYIHNDICVDFCGAWRKRIGPAAGRRQYVKDEREACKEIAKYVYKAFYNSDPSE